MLIRLDIICLLTLCFLSGPPVFAQGEDSLEPRPRVYPDSDQVLFKRRQKDSPVELTVNYPADASGFVDTIKSALAQEKHESTVKQDGPVWTLTDYTAKQTWIIKARHNKARDKFDPSALKAAAELYPGSQAVLSAVSRICQDQKNWPMALAYYLKANLPGPPDYSLEGMVLPPKTELERSKTVANCAYFELMMDHYQAAIKLLTTAIELDPITINNYKNRAAAYRKLHQTEFAERDEQKVKQLESTKKFMEQTIVSADTNATVPLTLVNLGEYEAALQMADAMLHKEPRSGMAHLVRARALVRLGRYNDALLDYAALAGITANAPVLNVEMAVAQKLAKQGPPPYGDLSLLLDSSAQTMSVAAGSGKRKAMISAIMAGDNDGNPRPLSLAAIASDHKGDFRVYSAICKSLKKRSMIKQLDSEVDKALAVVPDDTAAILDKIEAGEALFKWPEVEEYCSRYMALLTDNSVHQVDMDFLPYLYTVRALARRGQNNFAAAIDDASTVLKLNPGSAEAFRDRGDCYMQSGRYSLAIADYTQAIAHGDTRDSGAKALRTRAYAMLRQSDPTLQALDEEVIPRQSPAEADLSKELSRGCGPDLVARAALNGDQAVVVIRAGGDTAMDVNDCKMTGFAVARQVMLRQPKVKLVKVRFYGDSPRRYSEVSINAAALAKFGAALNSIDLSRHEGLPKKR